MADVLYSDPLVTLTEQTVTFARYYFPFGGAKTVPLAAIERVEVRVPTLLNGKWRLQGTGDFVNWFPMDMGRPGRDRIFVATLSTQRMRVAFTVEDGEAMEAVLRQRDLIR